jgi:hypothetical protein
MVTPSPDSEPGDRLTPEPTAVRMVRSGPVLVAGPVRITLPNGSVVESDRFRVALCACGRSRIYPFCDTSHRRRGS